MDKEKGKRKGSISQKMILRLGILMMVINLMVLIISGTSVRKVLQEEEADYMSEIVSNISNNINQSMEEFLIIAQVLAQSDIIINMLEDCDEKNPMHLHTDADAVVSEMNKVAQLFSENVLFIGIFDVDQDGYLMHDGDFPDGSFSFQEWDYYAPVLTKQAYISSPYLDTEINEIIVSVCYPIFSDKDGRVLGITLIDISTHFMADLIGKSHFGETGSSFVLDEFGDILAHETSTYIGQNSSILALGGNEILSELQNPSHSLINFTMNDVKRVGEVENIGALGWTLVSSMDTSEFNESSNQQMIELLILMSLSIIVTIIALDITVKFCLKPLAFIQKAMHHLSQGDIHYHLEYESNDEIGELADDLRFTMGNLSNYIQEIHRLLQSCSDGDFTVTSNMEFLGDFVAIQTSIDEFIVLISQALDSIKLNIEQVTVGSGYVATGSQSLSEGAAKQAETVTELNVSIHSITSTSKEITNHVQIVDNKAHQAVEELQKNNGTMKELMTSMNEINNCSSEIEKIIKTIEDVAFQTNILALNAAVEAARAGDAGRGFAVVAEEVRNLSQRTSVAVVETSNLIERTVNTIKRGTKQAETTSQGLADVSTFVSDFMKSLDEITIAFDEQAVAILDISDGINDITDVMQTNSAVSEQSAATSEELSSQAEVMQGSIEQFKTKKTYQFD